MLVDIELLEAFAHVAETGSVSRSARALHRTQPALSKQIARLEDWAGAQLFKRTGRGMRLTESGQAFWKRAGPLLADIRSLETDYRQDTALTGKVSAAFPLSFGTSQLAALASIFRSKHPKVDLHLEMALSSKITNDILTGTLDMGIVHHALRGLELEGKPLYHEERWLVGPKSARLRVSQPVSLREALQFPLILPGSGNTMRELVGGYASRFGIFLTVAIEVNHHGLLLSLIEEKQGYGFLPAHIVKPIIRKRAISASPITRPKLVREAFLATARKGLPSRAARAFADELRRFTQSMQST